MQATYESIEKHLKNIIFGFEVLSGNKLGDSDKGWQQVCAVTADHVQRLADELKEASKGNHESFMTFPSISELISDEE